MSRLKRLFKSIYSCLIVLFKYGPGALIRKIQNYEFHNEITQEKIDATHLYSDKILCKQKND